MILDPAHDPLAANDEERIRITIRSRSRSFTEKFSYLFSAKGAASGQPGATPQEKMSPERSAESANQNRACQRF